MEGCRDWHALCIDANDKDMPEFVKDFWKSYVLARENESHSESNHNAANSDAQPSNDGHVGIQDEGHLV